MIVRTFLQPTTLKQLFGYPTIAVEDTTAPEFTFVPADYTVECSDEMPMDDATASDNCGEVTIEVKRNHRWRCRRQLRDRSHLHCNRRR